MGNRGRSECVLALSESRGRLLWSRALGPVRSGGGGYPGPRCTPAVNGGCVYALGLNGDLVCLDAATGRRHWRKNLARDYGGRPGRWGYSESPLIDGRRLVCTPGGRRATLVALDRKTGRTLWKSAVPGGDRAAYASVVAVEVDGRRQYVQFLSGGVVGVAADSGGYLWRYNRPANGTANCATPVASGRYVLAASSYGAGGGLARLRGRRGRTRASEVYFTRHLKNHHGGLVLVDGYLYGATDPGSLVCLEFRTGRVMWRERRPGKGSITCAGGQLYYRNEGGPVLLIEANPRRYVERGYLKPSWQSGSPAWPYPVVANGRLYLRDQQVLWCFDVKTP
jgi:outer membrane protein assembly factor BamB